MTTGLKPVGRRPRARPTVRTQNQPSPRPDSRTDGPGETTSVVVPAERTAGQRLAPLLVFLAVLAILAAIILPAHLARS